MCSINFMRTYCFTAQAYPVGMREIRSTCKNDDMGVLKVDDPALTEKYYIKLDFRWLDK